DRIRKGMSVAEVEAILGRPGVYANGPVFLLALKQRALGNEISDAAHLTWYTDDATVSVDVDDSGGGVMTRFGPTSREEQGPLDSLLWRAKRQWRTWFPG